MDKGGQQKWEKAGCSGAVMIMAGMEKLKYQTFVYARLTSLCNQTNSRQGYRASSLRSSRSRITETNNLSRTPTLALCPHPSNYFLFILVGALDDFPWRRKPIVHTSRPVDARYSNLVVRLVDVPVQIALRNQTAAYAFNLQTIVLVVVWDKALHALEIRVDVS
jgi:hypothetical protein